MFPSSIQQCVTLPPSTLNLPVCTNLKQLVQSRLNGGRLRETKKIQTIINYNKKKNTEAFTNNLIPYLNFLYPLWEPIMKSIEKPRYTKYN